MAETLDQAEVFEEGTQGTSAERSGSAGLMSVEGILMITFAIILDIIGIILVIAYIGGATIPFAEIISWISDVLGLIIFGFWMLARWLWFKGQAGAAPAEMPRPDELSRQREKVAGEISTKSRQAVSEAKKIAKSGAKAGTKAVRFGRLGLVFLGEIIPLIGAIPFWTILVYSEMKKNGAMLV